MAFEDCYPVLIKSFRRFCFAEQPPQQVRPVIEFPFAGSITGLLQGHGWQGAEGGDFSGDGGTGGGDQFDSGTVVDYRQAVENLQGGWGWQGKAAVGAAHGAAGHGQRGADDSRIAQQV